MTQYPILIVGFAIDSEQAKIYYFAYRLAVHPIAAIAGMFQGLFFALLMQLKHDAQAQERTTFRVIRILNYITMMFGWMVAAVAEPLILALFGQKWLAAAPLVAILSVGVTFDAGAWIAGALLSARGEYRRALLYTIGTAPIYFVSIALGVLYRSVEGAAVGFTLSYIIIGPSFVLMAMHHSATPEHSMRTSYFVPSLSSLLPFLTCVVLKFSLVGRVNDILQIITLSAAYIAIAAMMFTVLRENLPQDLLAMARSRRHAV